MYYDIFGHSTVVLSDYFECIASVSYEGIFAFPAENLKKWHIFGHNLERPEKNDSPFPAPPLFVECPPVFVERHFSPKNYRLVEKRIVGRERSHENSLRVFL